MQGYGRTLITNAGSKMLTDVDGAKGKITYTKAVLYAQDIKGMSEDEQRALTEIDDEQMSTPVIVTDIKEETVTVSASFNNTKLTKDIAFNSIGWFAKTSVDDQERLLAVTPSDAEQTIVAGSSGASTSALDINMAFARNDNATVVIKPTEAGLINQAQLDAATNQVKVNLEAEIKTQVNNITDQMKNLGKVKKVQGKEPDADGNVDITFGKIIKGWDMSNNTYDPSQTKNNDSISNIWPVDQMVIAQVVSKLLSTETSLKSEIAKKDNTADVDDKLRNKINIADLIGYISDHNGNHLAETIGDANAISEPGIYFTKGGIKNLPLNNWGILQVIGITATSSDISHRKVQIYYPDQLNQMPYYRNLTDTTFSAWHQLASTDDITNLVNRINTLGKVQKVNNQWPGLDGNVNINTADNITILPDNSSFNDVIKPGFYRGNNLKDGPYTNVNDVFAIYGQKYAGGAITQVVYQAIHFNNTSRNYTRIYTRMGFFDSNLKVLWGNWNANIANIHINNTDPDNNGNVNINTLDNPTMLAYGSSLNNVIKPGFYRANACKDGPITDSIYNDVFCVIGVYKPGTVLTQFLPIAYYSTPDYLNNYTDLYLRTAYLDNNLIAHWGAYHKISTPLA
ncbi:MAG: pyocin knob domain-containing protein [Lactobacillus sp.]|nr:pyocin knob domain-containing protein [Lactobacillus sp.]